MYPFGEIMLSSDLPEVQYGELVSAWADIAPVWHRVVNDLVSICAIGQCKLAVGNFITSRALLYVIKRAQCVLVFDLG